MVSPDSHVHEKKAMDKHRDLVSRWSQSCCLMMVCKMRHAAELNCVVLENFHCVLATKSCICFTIFQFQSLLRKNVCCVLGVLNLCFMSFVLRPDVQR